MATDYLDADEVREVAERLIREIPDHQHLANAAIRYVFRRGTWDKAGAARKVTGATRHLTEIDFIMEIHEPTWNAMTDAQREALVDHELAHMMFGDEGQPQIADHDVEDFVRVVRRRGFWQPEMKELVLAAMEAEQLQLDLDRFYPGKKVAS